MHDEKMIFNYKDTKLNGILTYGGDNYAERKIVVMCHGLFSNMYNQKYELISEMLYGADIDSLRFNFSVNKDHFDISAIYGFPENTGQYEVGAIIDKLIEKGYKPENIGLLGSSQGGTTVILYAANKAHPGPIVLRAPHGCKAAYDRAKGIDSDTLVIFGSVDNYQEDAKKIFGIIPAKNKELYIIEGADHDCLAEGHINMLGKKIVSWLRDIYNQRR